MFKWLRRVVVRDKKPIDEDANRILAKPSNWSEPPFEPDPIAELVRIVGEAHDDPRSRNDTGAPSSLSDLNVKSLISLEFVFLARKIKLNDINMLSVKRTSSPTDC